MHQTTVKEESIYLMPDTSILLSSVVVAVKDLLGCDLRGEAVILDLQSGVYYGLDTVGVRIWELIQKPIRVGEVCAVILKEYEVDREICERDLCAFLRELVVNGLVEVKN